MYQFPIGVLLDSFKTDLFAAVKQAKAAGASGIQVRVSFLEPELKESAKRKEFLEITKAEGLAIPALCGELGHGLGDPAINPGLIEKCKLALDLAAEMDVPVVSTHIGVVPADPDHPRYQVMKEACEELARYAESKGVCLAIETGPETAETLKSFLDDIHSKGIGVNLDPANFVMVTGDDPVKAVYTLKDYIAHTHAKDGRRIYYRDPEEVYGLVESEMLGSPSFEELPLGEGEVDFENYLKALDEIGYRGFLTIEREAGDNRETDIKNGVRFLTERIK